MEGFFVYIALVFRALLITFLIFASMTSYGQSEERDTAYWEAYDAAMADRIWDGGGSPAGSLG